MSPPSATSSLSPAGLGGRNQEESCGCRRCKYGYGLPDPQPTELCSKGFVSRHYDGSLSSLSNVANQPHDLLRRLN